MTYPGHPTYTPVAPDAASPAGFPPAMEPWPTISPYEHGFDQTYNDDGIWFRQMLNKQRKYQVNVEFISGRFRQPGHAAIGADSVIGDIFTDRFGEAPGGINPFSIYTVKDAMVFSDQGRYLSEDSEIDYPDPPGAQSGNPVRPLNFALKIVGMKSGGNNNQDSVGTTDLTFPMNKAGLLQVVNWDGGTPNASIDFESEIAKTVLYPISGQALGEDAVTRYGGDPDIVMERHRNPSSPGLRFSLGLEDEDQSGVNWGAYYLSGQPTVFRRGTDDPNRPMLTNIVFFEAPHLGVGVGVDGIPNAGTDRLTPAFEVLDYNTLFEVTNETEVAGTDLAFYHTPFLDLGWMRMRPMWGARYDYIGETFGFTGRDNGYAYAYGVDGSAFTTTDADGEATGLGIYTPVLGSNQIPLTLATPFTSQEIYPYETTVKSRVQSHLYGPQVGFDWQAGGDNLMLFASTKTGVILNTEKLSLDTTGFGSTEALTGVRLTKSDSKTHTRFVPFLEFSANADVNVFPIIPVVNRWGFLKNARVRGGWTALVVGNVQRPIDQVVWRSDESGGAYIKERGRDAWYAQYWNVGVHWNF